MSANPLVKDFWYWVKGKLAGLCDHDIHDTHQIIGGVDPMKYVVM